MRMLRVGEGLVDRPRIGVGLVRTESDPTPRRSLSSRATSLPVTTPIEPVIVPALATIASADIDT